MSIRPRGLVLRLALLVGGTALLTVGLTACAVSPSTTTSPSVVVGETAMPGMDMTAMSHSEYTVEVVFQSAVVAGNNQTTVRVKDATTGEPLLNAVVHVTVNSPVQPETASDTEGAAATVGHAEDGADGHDSAGMDMDMDMDTMDHAQAGADGHDAAGTTVHEEAAADDHNTGEEAAGHGHAAPADVTLQAGSVPGEYLGQVEVPDVGDWLLTVHVAAEDADQEVRVAVTATRDIGRLIALGGFLSLNIAIIATAAITKRKTVQG
jgi:hypothetical protein